MNNQLSQEEWIELAQELNDSNTPNFIVIGSIAAGLGVAAVTAFPPAGLLTAVWGLYASWKAVEGINTRHTAIEQGLIAPILKGEKLKQYIDEMGKETAIDQIKQARDRDLPLSHDAEDLIEEVGTGAIASPVFYHQENTAWVQNLIKQTALIWGNQGGGKSWLTRYVAKEKKQAGYRVIVLDPDSNKAEWRGVESYHSWEDIEQQIKLYIEELEKRLSDFNASELSEKEWQIKLEPIALICEEATTYGDFIKNTHLLEKFGKLALTKSRKPMMPVTVVAHNNTQNCLFGIRGLFNLVQKMLQVKCLATVDKNTLEPKASGAAQIKLDSSLEWLAVTLPKMENKITQF